MITLQEWKSMSIRERTLFLDESCKINGRGGPRKLVHGVGENDSPACISQRISGKLVACPAYHVWKGVLQRCYDTKCQDRHPSYIGVTVCDEWHKFSKFRLWWLEHQVDGYQLDKDLLSDGKLYSPETCLFVPQWLNAFIIDRRADRGAWPIGVYFNNRDSRFQAQCSNPFTKKNEFLGYFSTPEAAHLAWRTRKLELALELKPKMDSIDQRIYDRVVEIIMKAR